MKRQLVKAFVVTILTLISASGNGADPRSLIEFKKNGTIDWTTGVVEAKGIGVPATYTYPRQTSGSPRGDPFRGHHQSRS